MAKALHRLIQEAFFENLGPLSASELLAMPRDGWESLRSALTDQRNGKGDQIARCAACQSQIYITTSHDRPLFAHYQGADPRCPWFSGKNKHPNDVRAKQYRGQQESVMHRRMCDLIAELAALDERCVSTKVDEYLPPTENTHGRYPDVLVEWRGFGKFAVEYQRSHTFQTELSQRCIHYNREGIPLLWLLSSFEQDRIPQAVSDVVHRHRGNAFVLDQQAISASREQNTLVLKCYLSNGDGYDPPVLTRFDALNFPDSQCPFLEDRLIVPLLEQIKQRRMPYFHALRSWGDRIDNLPVAELGSFPERKRIDRLVAAAFSIVAEAAGKPQNFASDHKTIKAMMNTFQNSGSLAPYALLLTKLIENTSARSLLRTKVGDHLRRSIEGHRKGHIQQARERSPEWVLLRELLPEALDPFTRQRLIDGNALPSWAKASDVQM